MSQITKAVPVTLGFRVKSGWATAVLLAGPVKSPQVLDSRIVYFSDPSVPESRQPYHAAMGKLEKNDAELKRRIKVIERVTAKSLSQLLKHYSHTGHKVGVAGLVVGSQIEPQQIKNPHIRAHALEGRLFRVVLETALRSEGLSSFVILEREAFSKAAAELATSQQELKSRVSSFGRSLTGPWRADEKLAALAAWIALTHRH